ncbi:cellulose biosynthesis cyclic di-GMP-binding regulatory protein BcsB [Shinella sp. CPCC 101442]|uniref:cellulose biosynthesis cyclic di-GMP-binding regulatory protein BcsB n=1 Tax=Shinella sp. CPCC 101442 TaxID=2932265 RepID=UPI0021522636|nr:cellulose biosynthesis cyclic di-GMP-binding regulatory protein BcsB [Shinella sp. CPCC 101442]MCR6501107.1 cellulose biosynthesis cyclic di-GMP-binding regulatory protein BcsB [Shinella sp. CPCC 101442]
MAKTSLLGMLGLALLVASADAGRAEGLVADAVKPLLESTTLSGGLLPQPVEVRTQKGQAVASGNRLVPFEQSADAYTLSGEDDVATFTFALDGPQVSAGGTLNLAYINAVSVLPDTAKMDIEVNGRDAGSFAIASPNGVLTEKIAIASDLLKAGRNVVRIRARQHHRVDCSLDATYELWTKLDPAQSGFATSSSASFSDFDSLLAVRRNANSRTDVRVVVPGALSTEALNEVAPILQSLILFLNRDDVTISVDDKPGTGAGVDLVMAMDRGGSATLAKLGIANVPRGLSVQAGATPDRATVVLHAANLGDVNAAVLAAVKGPMADGLKSGVFAKGRGALVVDAGERRMLKETGYETRVFSGRLSRTDFTVDMPADFYPAEYATLDLRLHAATSPGLEQTAQLLVRVNDKVVKSYPFRNREGEQFDGKRIELPLRAFRPGANRVELLAELPTVADAACRPEERDDGKPRFILLDTTAIEVPALARIGRLPDLAALAGKAYPYGGGKPFDLVIDRADSQSAAAGLSMLTRLALSARAPLTAKIAIGAPAQGTGRDALIVSSQNDFAELGASSKAAFPDAGDINASVADLLKPDPVSTASVSDAAAGTGNDTADLLQAFHNSTAADEGELSFGSRAQLWLSAASRSFGRWLSYEGENATRVVPHGEGSLVTLSQMRSPDGLATWTVLQANSPRDIDAGVQRLVEPAVWRDLQGGTATIETASLSLVSLPAADRYVADLADRSPGNLRRVAAAWFSDNFQIYVVLVLACLGLFAVWLGLTVPRKGVRSDR